MLLAEGSSFAISDPAGDMTGAGLHGLFLGDLRVLSRWELRVNGASPEPITVAPDGPFAATFVSRARAAADTAEPSLVVLRRRQVASGLVEEIEVRNFGDEAAYCSVELWAEADFASLSEVRDGAAHTGGGVLADAEGPELSFRYRRADARFGIRVLFPEAARVGPDGAAFEAIVPAGGRWTATVDVYSAADGEAGNGGAAAGAHPRSAARAQPAERLARWRRQVPLVFTDYPPLEQALRRSAEDLGSLRLFDPDHPERVLVAAGVPWSMAVYGRDSLLTSWMALPLDPDLAMGVLQTLARFQGSEVDPRTEEEPGRILYRMRFGAPEAPGGLSYGSVDATPLFVMLLGELRRWGLASEVVDELLPHADRALEWVREHGDRDGDGYVEYRRQSDRSPVNQGWKDSPRGIRFSDGRVAEPPIAVAEVQGYVYAAYVARAHFAREAGDEAAARSWHTRAAELKAAFNRDFWLPHRGWYALALDADKRPVDALCSNMGHCLWTGIVDEERAPVVAERLMSPEMFSGWGLRTLGSTMGGYNPVSYHCGAVWPHDTAIAAAGLMRYGFVEEAQRLAMGMLAAAASSGGRLPELMSGLSRDELPSVAPHPGACSPQACSAAAPLLLLRSLLRFDPWVPNGRVWLAPALPEEIGHLVVDRVPLGGARIRIEVDGPSLKVEGLPAGVELVQAGRRPLTAG